MQSNLGLFESIATCSWQKRVKGDVRSSWPQGEAVKLETKKEIKSRNYLNA